MFVYLTATALQTTHVIAVKRRTLRLINIKFFNQEDITFGAVDSVSSGMIATGNHTAFNNCLHRRSLRTAFILVLVKMVENHFIAPTACQELYETECGVFLIKRNRFIKNQY